MLNIRIVRYNTSLEYKKNAKKPFDWYNNDAHNCEDEFILYWGTLEVFRAKVQTVANMQGLDVPERGSPRIKFEDTVAPGPFLLKTFVDPRNFYGRIHGICDTKTLAGDYISMASITKTNYARWLAHDDQKHRTDAKGAPVAPGTLTRVKWSAGCFVMGMKDLATLRAVLEQYGATPGITIAGVLVEEKRA